MDKRTMYNKIKELGSIYSDAYIHAKIDEYPTVRNFRITDTDTVDYGRQTLFTLHNEGFDKDFRKFVKHDRQWMSESYYEERYLIPLQPQATEEAEEFFTEAQISRIEQLNSRFNLRRFHSYGSGDQVYNEIGVLSDGDNDDSPTVGFELETQMALGCGIDRQAVASEYLDIRLGHVESDGSISGVEFDSHIFTWNKLKKVKPLVEKQLTRFVEAGLAASQGAGLHIHIGRNAFASEESFRTFYYIINAAQNQAFWETIARRTSNNYAQYRAISDRSLRHVMNSINRHRNEHGAAVNQEHTATYEIRIFQSTLSADVLYGCIEILMNLVKMCNQGDDVINMAALLNGDYAQKYSRILSERNIARHTASVDVTFLKRITMDRLRELVNEALAAGDVITAQSYLTSFNNQGGNA